MSFPDVLKRGDDFLYEHKRNSPLWKAFSYADCIFALASAKVILKTLYNVRLHNFEKLENALEDSKREDRSLLTVMNHMSVVDDPFLWATFPWRIYKNLENIRWGLGANNVCFQNKFSTYLFSLGQVLPTKRFGTGPFQGSIDACIRLMSENKHYAKMDDSKLNYLDKINYNFLQNRKFKRKSAPWVHVFPEGFVLQLHPPFNNSMRYFKWGVARLILEATEPPIVVPIFSTGFEKIAPEDTAEEGIKRYLPHNIGCDINVTIGDRINDDIIAAYREEWKLLVEKYTDPQNPNDLSFQLKYGDEAQELRSRVAAELRSNVGNIRHNQGNFPKEDERFKSPSWWKKYTLSEGESDKEVKFIGKNWAVRRFQSFLNNTPEGQSNSNK